MIGLVVFLLICFGLTWIPFNNFEIEKMNSSYLDGIPNPYWVFPVMMAIVIAIILILTSLALVFNKRKRQAKIKEIENKLEQTKKYEEKNGETLNDSKGFNQLKLCVKTIDEFGPFIDELRKDGKKITILDKEKIIEKLEDLYIVPVYFVTFLRLLCFSNKNLSKDEAAVIIDAMYDSRISLYREDEELKKIIDKRRETLPDDAHQLSVYINDLSEKHKDDFEEILILSRIFFEKNYTFSGE